MTFRCSLKCVEKCCAGMRGLYEREQSAPVRVVSAHGAFVLYSNRLARESAILRAVRVERRDVRCLLSGAVETRRQSAALHFPRETTSRDRLAFPRLHRATMVVRGAPAARRVCRRGPRLVAPATRRILSAGLAREFPPV